MKRKSDIPMKERERGNKKERERDKEMGDLVTDKENIIEKVEPLYHFKGNSNGRRVKKIKTNIKVL